MAKKENENKIPGWVFAVGIILAIVLVFGGWIGSTYNSFVGMDETVNNAWGNVQTSYQRRADLIPNLVATVKASAEFETNLQTEVTKARSGIANARTPAELDLAGQQINTLINVVFEQYPDIKSTEAFKDLQVQLEGTENRIKVDRDNYNGAVRTYNTKARRFPSNIIAGMFNFDEKDYFASQAGSENAPNVGGLFN